MKEEFNSVQSDDAVKVAFYSKTAFKEVSKFYQVTDSKHGMGIVGTLVTDCKKEEIDAKFAEYRVQYPDARVAARDVTKVEERSKAGVKVTRSKSVRQSRF